MANSVDPDQTAPIGAVCSGSTLFASIPNSSAMLGNSLPQTTSADDVFRCIFFLAQQGLKEWRTRQNLCHDVDFLNDIVNIWSNHITSGQSCG